LLPRSLRAGALSYSDATPGSVTALLRLNPLATHFGGLSSDPILLLPPSVEPVLVRNRAEYLSALNALSKTFRLTCAGPTALSNKRTEKNMNVGVEMQRMQCHV